MEYWLNWVKPDNPIINSLLVWPMYSIDKSNSIRTKKNNSISNSMKWNKNAVKNFEKVSKQLQTVENSLKQLKTDKTDRSIEDIEDNINIKKENIKEKKCYLENVWLSDEEYNKLTASYWKQVIEEYIVKLSDYMLSKGKGYTDHYRTILKRLAKSWVKKKWEHVNDGDEPYDFSKDKIILPVRKRQWEISK